MKKALLSYDILTGIDEMRVSDLLSKLEDKGVLPNEAVIYRDAGYYDDPDEINVRVTRLETDEEYERRLAEEAAWKQAEKDRRANAKKLKDLDDLATYQRLKAKFEKTETKKKDKERV